MKSCIYRGSVNHERASPTGHRFRYDLFMMYLDLDELPALFDQHWLWSARRPAPAWFRRKDYLGTGPLDEAVREEAQRLTGIRPIGPIRVLTHLRYFGYVMNPVTFYYCFSENGDRVDTILAEITNTPWNERHTYALRSEQGDTCGTPHEFTKAFHISPFMAMTHEYSWRLSAPGERLHVHMENREDGEKVFDATLHLRRHNISSLSLASALGSFPWMTVRVLVGIYWQAFRLWLKKTPYFEHPISQAADA